MAAAGLALPCTARRTSFACATPSGRCEVIVALVLRHSRRALVAAPAVRQARTAPTEDAPAASHNGRRANSGAQSHSSSSPAPSQRRRVTDLPPANKGAGNIAAPAGSSSSSSTAATSSGRLSDSQLLSYERNGYLVTRQLLPADETTALRDAVHACVASQRLAALRQRVRVLCPGIDPMSLADEAAALRALRHHGTDSVGFLQFFNLHNSSEVVRRVACGPRLAAAAAQLLGCRRVRLYQDAVFLKEPGFTETNWCAAFAAACCIVYLPSNDDELMFRIPRLSEITLSYRVASQHPRVAFQPTRHTLPSECMWLHTPQAQRPAHGAIRH